MELVASLPPSLAAIADPTARAAAPPLRPTDQDDAAATAAVPFEWLLGLLAAPLPGGESLPATGNGLPAAAVDAACDSTAPSSALARPVTSAPLQGADLLTQLKLAAAPAPSAQDSAPPGATGRRRDYAALPISTWLPPADVAATKPPAGASTPPAAAAQALVAPGPEVAAALEAALPQTPAQDASPKSPRAGQARAPEQTVARPSAAVAMDLRSSR